MRQVKYFCTIAVMFLILHLPMAAQSTENHQLADSLFDYYISVVERALYHTGQHQGARVVSIDPITHDTLYIEPDLNNAVHYLEHVTRIYMPRSKMGEGFILNPQVFDRWKNFRNTRFAVTQSSK